jgi:hypothetical protein
MNMTRILKRIYIVLLLCLTGFSSFTLPGPPGKGLIKVRYPLLPEYIHKDNVSQHFCEKNTNKTKGDPRRNIHNGIDIPVPHGNTVYSLCDGEVVGNYTSKPYWDSFLIIRHNCCNRVFYAYYGHISSELKEKDIISEGQKIGIIRHDEDKNSRDHLHLSITTGKDWDNHGWGYNYSCQEAEAEGYVDPLKYLQFTDKWTIEPPVLPTQKKFDIKTPLNEKELSAAVKSGFVAYIKKSGWAIVKEIGEDNSLWITNYVRTSQGSTMKSTFNFEIRTPAMFTRGRLLFGKQLSVEWDISEVERVKNFEPNQLHKIIEKQLNQQCLFLIPTLSALEEMKINFKFFRGRDLSPAEALEGMIVGAHVMAVLIEDFLNKNY